LNEHVCTNLVGGVFSHRVWEVDVVEEMMRMMVLVYTYNFLAYTNMHIRYKRLHQRKAVLIQAY